MEPRPARRNSFDTNDLRRFRRATHVPKLFRPIMRIFQNNWPPLLTIADNYV